MVSLKQQMIYLTLVLSIRVNQHLLPYLVTASCRTLNICSDLKILCDSLLSCVVDISWSLGILWELPGGDVFADIDSVNAFGRKWIVDVVDVLDLPEVVDPLASSSLWALFYAFIGFNSLSVEGKLHCNLNVFVVVLYLMLADMKVSRLFFLLIWVR